MRPSSYPFLNRGHDQFHGLVHIFPFWEGAGLSVQNLLRPQYDAALVNAPSFTFWTDGPLGKGMFLDGGDPTVSYAATSPIILSAPFTITAWCYPTFTNGVFPQDFAVVVDVPVSSPGSDPFALWALQTNATSPAKFRAYISTGVAGSGVTVDGATSLAANTLFFVAMTYDGSTLKLYVNGVLDGSASTSISLGTSTTNFTWFGRHGTTGFHNCWKGMIYEVRMYTVAKSEAQIAAMYAEGTRWDLYRLPKPYPKTMIAFAQAVSQSISSPWESGVSSIVRSAVSPWESQSQPAVSRLTPYEMIGGSVSQEASTPWESTGTTEGGRVSPWEAIGAPVEQSRVSPYESLGTASATKTTPHEAAGTVTKERLTPWETLFTRATKERTTPYEVAPQILIGANIALLIEDAIMFIGEMDASISPVVDEDSLFVGQIVAEQS